MQTMLFVIPLKPGKLDAYNAFFAEITGPRKDDYKDLLKRYGLKNVKVWHHRFADKDYVMVLHDMEDDAMERLQSWSSSTHPFDCWFDEQIFNCYDAVNFDNLPEQPQFLYGFEP